MNSSENVSRSHTMRTRSFPLAGGSVPAIEWIEVTSSTASSSSLGSSVRGRWASMVLPIRGL
jgi:hypothetical protein